MTHYFSPDKHLEFSSNAWRNRSLNPTFSAFDVLKERYLHLNEKWRNQLILILCDYGEELIAKDCCWDTFNYLYDKFDINPNSIGVAEIKALFEWIQDE